MAPRLNIPPITRIALIVLVFQSTLCAGIRYRQSSADTDLVPYLALVPQLSIIFPWTFLVTTLVENNVFTLAIAVLTLFYGGRYLERAWTSAEFARFLLIVSLIPNLITFGTLVALFAITGDVNWTLTSINGSIPLQISFLVAFSQLLPAHTVTLFRGVVSLRVPRFPLIHILAITILSLTPLLSIASFLLVTTAFLTSWTYLRFYKSSLPDLESSQPSSLRGDPSESFAFAEFFPDPVKPTISAFARQVFDLLVALRICTPFSAADISASRGESMMQRGGGGARAEAERRRAVALKALDQRLSAATGGPSPKPSGPPPSAQPSVQIQAQPNAPPEMLGETSYVPEREDGKHGP